MDGAHDSVVGKRREKGGERREERRERGRGEERRRERVEREGRYLDLNSNLCFFGVLFNFYAYILGFIEIEVWVMKEIYKPNICLIYGKWYQHIVRDWLDDKLSRA